MAMKRVKKTEAVKADGTLKAGYVAILQKKGVKKGQIVGYAEVIPDVPPRADLGEVLFKRPKAIPRSRPTMRFIGLQEGKTVKSGVTSIVSKRAKAIPQSRPKMRFIGLQEGKTVKSGMTTIVKATPKRRRTAKPAALKKAQVSIAKKYKKLADEEKKLYTKTGCKKPAVRRGKTLKSGLKACAKKPKLTVAEKAKRAAKARATRARNKEAKLAMAAMAAGGL